MEQAEAGVTRIALNTPTIHGAVLHPRPVNFLYGKNGTGKTSIGKAIADEGSDITWADDTAEGAKVYLYNEAFINNNVHSYGQLPGVYALSEENVEIRRLIDGKTKEKEKADTEKSVDKTIANIVEKEEGELVDDYELVAVITAAIKAYEGNASADGFVVRSIKKSQSKKWQNAQY